MLSPEPRDSEVKLLLTEDEMARPTILSYDSRSTNPKYGMGIGDSMRFSSSAGSSLMHGGSY